MSRIEYGRLRLSFRNGTAVRTSTSVTERALAHEDEHAFTKRLLERYRHREGTIEIIFKAGHPEYAVITFSDAA